MRKGIIDKVLVITASSLIIKILGFVFRIYLSNLIGQEGMGLYQLVLSVYALGATLSTSGISVTISRLTAIYNKNAKKILKTGIFITETLSFIVLFVIYMNAEYIGEVLLKDSRTVASLKMVSLSFPAISLFACLSGYFNGLTKVKYPMRGQITEQLVRILFVLLIIPKAIKNGLKSALFVTSTGIVLGEYLSLLYLYVKYRSNLKNEKQVYIKKTFLKDILKISIPISLNGYFQSFIHTIESVILPSKFVLYGYTHKGALSMLGTVKGMAMPLIFFPTVVLSAVSTISLPYISKAQSGGELSRIKRAVRKSLLLACITGLGITFFFLAFGDIICKLIYGNIEIADTLKKLTVLIPMMYINIVALGILNGLGKQKEIMIVGVIEGIIKIAMISVLIPALGFLGYTITIVVGELIGTVSYLAIIIKNLRKKGKSYKNKHIYCKYC